MATSTETATRSGTVTIDRTTSDSVRKQRRVRKTITYIALTITGLIFAFPLYWTASSSLQTWQELRSFTPHLVPASPQWQNYVDVFTTVPFARWMANSFLIVAITIPGTIITSTLTAYSFARFNFVGKNVWFILMLGTMMIPATVTLIPQYLLWFKLGFINTYVPLTIGSWLGGSAFMIFLLRQFILTIPRDLDEAATMTAPAPSASW
ncbi:MAG: carbohydrate ABC transporter permease [Caldilineaceae bacterium]|nr:carbohydrate ABC transporter permease [Caldilineaceae bacterium]